jgi:hypothetical protein
LLGWPDATPSANFPLHIGYFWGCEISNPFHEPGDLAHQINDRLIAVPPLDPFAKAQQIRCHITHSHSTPIPDKTFAHSF